MKKTIVFLSFCFALPGICRAEIPMFASVNRLIYRGGQPEKQSDYEYLYSKGVRSIMNLRTTSSDIAKERAMAKKLGMEFRSVPISGLIGPKDEDMNQIMDYLSAPRSYPVFIHCQHGQDRTGLAVGIYRVRYESWSKNAAYEEMKSFGFREFLLGLSVYFWKHADDFDESSVFIERE